MTKQTLKVTQQQHSAGMMIVLGALLLPCEWSCHYKFGFVPIRCHSPSGYQKSLPFQFNLHNEHRIRSDHPFN